MSNRLGLMKSINKLGRQNKGAIKIPIPAKYAPQSYEPHTVTTNDIHMSPPEQLGPIETWQVNWMNQFAQSRNEYNENLKKEQFLNDELKVKLAKQNELLKRLLKCLDKRNNQIQKYKNRCVKAKMLKPTVTIATNTDLNNPVDASTNTQLMEFTDASTNTQLMKFVDASTNTILLKSVDVATNTDSTQIPGSEIGCGTSATDIGSVPLDAATNIKSSEIQYPGFETTHMSQVNSTLPLAKYKCPDCSYSTNKKHTLVVHQAEFCINPPIKDRECKFCRKSFTRRALRVHINQYVTCLRNRTGEHKDVSIDEHKMYLNEIKAEIHD